MSALPNDFSDELEAAVERYLDELLPAREARAFEQRVREDPEAFDALVEAMTLRAMVQLAFEGGMDRDPEYCREMLGLVPDYLADELEPVRKGEFAHHLDACDHCADIYDSCTPVLAARRDRRQRRRSVLGAATAGSFAILAVLGVAFRLSGEGTAEVPTPGVAAPAAAASDAWPELPVPPAVATEIALALRDLRPAREAPAELPGLPDLWARVEEHDANARERLADHAVLRGFLLRHDLDPENPDHLFLSAILHESRLSDVQRSWAVIPLTLRHRGDHASWLRELVADAPEGRVAARAMATLITVLPEDHDPDEFLRLGRASIAAGRFGDATRLVARLVKSRTRYAVTLAREMQEAPVHASEPGSYVDPVRQLARLDAWRSDPALERRVLAFVDGDAPAWRRLLAMKALSEFGDAEAWRGRMTAFLEHSDPRVLRVALDTLRTSLREEDRASVERLSHHPDRLVSRRAQSALKELGSH